MNGFRLGARIHGRGHPSPATHAPGMPAMSNHLPSLLSPAEICAGTLPHDPDRTQVNTVRAGAGLVPPGFEVLSRLGQGMSGVVYRARHVALDREVALKMLVAGSHASPDAIRRFVIEAEAIAALRHPNIVQVYHAGRHDG